MKWGISLYPEHSTVEQDCAYIERAAAHGFARIFSCLLSVEGDPEQVKHESAELTACAHANGMEVVFDVAPNVFAKLGIPTTTSPSSTRSAPTASAWTSRSSPARWRI